MAGCSRGACLLGLAVLAFGCQQNSGSRVTENSSPGAETPVDQLPPRDEAAKQDVVLASGSEVASSDVPGQGAERPPQPLLDDWVAPVVAIVLTGEQLGHLEPCGCSERQSGGLARRMNMVRQLETRGWTVTGFDLGGTLERTRRQSEMKFDYTRSALNSMGYKCLGLGPGELRLGAIKLFDFHSRTASDEDFDVPFVSANVTLLSTREIGSPLEYRIVDVSGVKIAVTSVLGQTYEKELFPGGGAPDPSELMIESVDEALPRVIQKMRAEQPDVMLLLSYAKPAESRQIAGKYPVFDLLVTAGSPEDPLGEAEVVGKTLILEVGTKGKNAGVVGYYPDQDPKFRFAVVDLDRFRFQPDPAIDELMAEYQQLLQDENLVANEPSVRNPFGDGYTYVGSEKCADCHTEEYEIWDSTPHRHAFESLTVAYAQASGDPSLIARVRIDRIHDPECVNCHTTGWDAQDVLRFEGGFTGRATTPLLVGVNCENCHGPASKHVELEEAGAADGLLQAERNKLHLSVKTAETQLCMKCHDGDNSPDFNFKTYWPQIEH